MSIRHSIPYHNETSYDPNASLGGQMDKYWDMSGETPELVKESYRFYGQQSLNEEFATIFHRASDEFQNAAGEMSEQNGRSRKSNEKRQQG